MSSFRSVANRCGGSDARASAMTAPLPAAIANADECRLALPTAGEVFCYRDGAGDGMPVLLLHSINAAPSAAEVRPLFDALRGRRPVLAPDLPGFGRSGRPDRDYSPTYYSAFIRELIQHAGGGPMHVVALSTSSEFAARAALEAPDLIASLTAVSPTGLGLRSPPSGMTSERIHRFLRTPLLGRALFRLLRSGPSVRFFLGLAFAGAPPADLVQYARRTAAQPGAWHAPFHFLSGKLFTPDAVGTLYRKVAVPALVLYDTDPNVSFERLDELLQDNAHWSATRIPGTRGLPHFDRPQPTQEALQDFWARCETGGSAS